MNLSEFGDSTNIMHGTDTLINPNSASSEPMCTPHLGPVEHNYLLVNLSSCREAISNCHLKLPSQTAISNCHLKLPSQTAISNCHLALPSPIPRIEKTQGQHHSPSLGHRTHLGFAQNSHPQDEIDIPLIDDALRELAVLGNRGQHPKPWERSPNGLSPRLFVLLGRAYGRGTGSTCFHIHDGFQQQRHRINTRDIKK